MRRSLVLALLGASLAAAPAAGQEPVVSQFEERFCAVAETVSSPGRRLVGTKERAKATLFAALSPLL